MWMAYAEQSWEKAVDIKSAVTRLHQSLKARRWDAEHEAVYGMERFYSTEYCQQLAEKYNSAADICEDYLEKRITIDDLCKKFIDCDMKRELYDIRNFLVYEIVLKYGLQICNCNSQESIEIN